MITALTDTNEDVQLLCLVFLNKLVHLCPMVLSAKIEQVAEKFQAIYQKNSSNLKKEDDAERALNLMRSVLRVCESLQRNPETSNNINFQQWFTACVLENQEVPIMRLLYDKIVSTTQ